MERTDILLIISVVTYAGVALGLYRLLVKALEKQNDALRDGLRSAESRIHSGQELAARVQVIEKHYEMKIEALQADMELARQSADNETQAQLAAALKEKEEALVAAQRLRAKLASEAAEPYPVALLMLARSAPPDWRKEAGLFAELLRIALMAEKHNLWHRHEDCAVLCAKCGQPMAMWGSADMFLRRYTCLNVKCENLGWSHNPPEGDRIVPWKELAEKPAEER